MNYLKGIRHFKLTFLIVVLFSLSCSFNAKDNYLKDFTAFVVDVEKNYESYTTEDWEVKDAEFKQYAETRFDDNKTALTKEDRKAIGKLVARFSIVRVKGFGKQFKEGLDDAQSYIEGFLEGLTDETNDKE